MSVTSISAQSKYVIPGWVKGVAGFWSEGKIADDEFGDGLSFLINNNIIKVPKIYQLQSENTKLQSENTQLQSGNTPPIQNPTTPDGERCLVFPKPNIDLHGCNLGGADLKGVDLTNANLGGADLKGVDLTNAILSGTDFTGANLTGANLNGVFFSGGTVVENAKYTNFTGANLSGITYTGCIGSAIGIPSAGTLPICMSAP